MEIAVLLEYENRGLVRSQKHPILPLSIWNYTQTTQYECAWDNVTLQTRGLVMCEDTNRIAAKSLNKFFNIEEGKHTPTKDFKVYEKMDGSCIICFHYNNEWIFCSRGSFTSEQAELATEFSKKYPINLLDKTKTYIFELIAKNNRIVVDYGNYEGLVLLGAIDTVSSEEVSFEQLKKLKGFDIVKEYDNINDYESLKEIIHDNQEGFVIHFSNGDRCKIKGEEYIRLHRIMTNASTTSIWDVLRSGDSMEEYLKEVPDEFYEKIKDFKDSLEDEYWEIADKAKSIFNSIFKEDMKAREFAYEVKYLDKVYQGLLWAQFNLKMKNYSEIIWNNIKPEFRKI